jgi:hypothetical protein
MALEEPDFHAPPAQPTLHSTLSIITDRGYDHVKDMVKLRLRLGLAIRPRVNTSASGGRSPGPIRLVVANEAPPPRAPTRSVGRASSPRAYSCWPPWHEERPLARAAPCARGASGAAARSLAAEEADEEAGLRLRDFEGL